MSKEFSFAWQRVGNAYKKIENDEQIITNMYYQTSYAITENKTKMIYQINNTLVETNFMVGKIIVENEKTVIFV